MPDDERCPAAHADDPTSCKGPHHAVRILDAEGYETWGCEHHGARLLASLEGGKVFPGEVGGAANRVVQAADLIRPFPWYENAPRTEPSQRSHAENRARRDIRTGPCACPIQFPNAPPLTFPTGVRYFGVTARERGTQ